MSASVTQPETIEALRELPELRHSSRPKPRVVVVHAATVMREGMVGLLKERQEIELVASFRGARDVLDRAPSGELILLYDLETAARDGLELMSELKRRLPEAKLLHINVPEDDATTIVNCVRAGTTGCILSGASTDDMVAAIHQVARGEIATSPGVMMSLFSYIAGTARTQDSPLEALTRREEQVFELLMAGMCNKEIARRLFLQPQTVKNYARTIYEKLDVHSRTELMRLGQARNRANRWDVSQQTPSSVVSAQPQTLRL
jgi:DNA-binding NarL/FixJ family response regulator